MNRFDLLEFLTDMNREKDITKSFSIFADACASVGFDRLVYSLLTPHDTIGYKAGHAIVGNYPDDWMSYYEKNNYITIDPVVKQAKHGEGLLKWSDLHKLGYLKDQKEIKLMDEAREAGLYSGMALSLKNYYGEVVGMGFASSDNNMVIDKPTENFILLIAKQFDLNFKSIALEKIKKDHPEDNIILTDTQKEVLLWIARDKKYSEIADIMMVSENTIKFHTKEIFKRLHVHSQISAVLKAVRIGIIEP